MICRYLPSAISPSRRLSGSCVRAAWPFVCLAGLLLLLVSSTLPASVLFQDDFNRGIPGWTAVQPPGNYTSGPLRWQYDIVSGGFVEQSNIYTDSSTVSATATAPMLINDTVTAASFTFSARMTAGDDDGFGLIFGYQNETNFYRVTFARQSRTGFPWTGWAVDRKVNGVTANLFGAGTAGYVPTFINTSNRAFDVTISVDASSRLTLSVVDNPTGTPTSYPLVTSQALPAPANGKVGLMTWGMSGAVPRGFRIQNVSLSPAGLTGNPNALTNWTAVVPPRANGSTTVSGGHGQPLWSLSVGTAGPYGTLQEGSDCLAGNDTAGQVDFTGPTIVAGSNSWADYTVAARITPGDDDGHGLLLRYQNTSNFYRIALRSQASATGVPRGLSVQKNASRTYTEVYRETTVQYDPVAGVTYDLLAAITGSTLNLLLVADPEGAARPYSYGPLALSGVPAGKIGLFSWGMSKTDFDWVSVQDGTPLYISAPPSARLRRPKGLTASPRALWSPLPQAQSSKLPGCAGFPPAGTVPALSPPVAPAPTLSSRSTPSPACTGCGERSTSSPSPTAPAAPCHSLPVNGLRPAQRSRSWPTLTPASPWRAGPAPPLPPPPRSTSPWTSLTASRPSLPRIAMRTACPMIGKSPALAHSPRRPWPIPTTTAAVTAQSTTTERIRSWPTSSALRACSSWAIRACSWSPTTPAPAIASSKPSPPLTGWTTIATTQLANVFTSSLPLGNSAFWRLQQPARPAEALPFVPGSWTLVVLPDTQVYSASHPELFKDQARWIVANRNRYNIKYVLTLGDLTNNNTTNQWANVKAALSMLDGVVPYVLVNGNHDYGANGGTADRTTFLNDYFPVTNFTSWPTFGGVMEPNRMDNTYHLFSAGGADWLILACEFGPRDSVVTWANSDCRCLPQPQGDPHHPRLPLR